MQAAALLAKRASRDASALPAPRALSMATICGARALGRERDIGSLEPGKCADLIAIDLSTPESQPLYHPLSQLVYACSRHQVTHSWINGRMVMEHRQIAGQNTGELMRIIQQWQTRIASHEN